MSLTRMRHARLRASVLTCSLFGVATHAQAFRNPDFFGDSAEGGGGGGKYFTVSRAEGYGCAVCHTPGEAVAVQLRNLPKDGYLPGQAYRITVDWPDDMPSVALNVEMTDFDGAPFGQLLAPDPLTLAPADLCPDSDQPSAGQSIPEEPGGRRVLLIAECGQAQTSFDWIAPSAPAQGYFSASITFSNRDGKLTGDSVVDLAESVGIQGLTQPTANKYQGQCSALTPAAVTSGQGARKLVAWVALAYVLRLRRRRRQQEKRQTRRSS